MNLSMDQKICEKRKALGLTQEQVANYLGVTTPAVNKWEKGATCPDLALLPALARLLKTDPNTLLCFEESLKKQEIAGFLNEAVEKIKQDGYAEGFAWMSGKAREYPNCAELLHSAAMLLEGALLMANLPESEKEGYTAQITAFYERVARCDDPALADRARYMLVSRLLREGKYSEAQELLDRLPERDTPDKRTLQAQLWAKQGKPAEAAQLLERKVFSNLQENLVTLAELVRYEIEAGEEETAARLAQASQTECEAFGLWRYSAYLAPVQAAVARKDAADTLALFSKMLEAMLTPWDVHESPIFSRFPKKETSVDFAQMMLPSLLSELERNPDYDFLRGEPEFKELIREYREKCSEGKT
ncbi:MAG: helix-turn-helix domain-containing protein [Oscillospiraceae bacterium]|nr:helix-turn-helix domain-containing protein [Oscillospiraceae bacterium]